MADGSRNNENQQWQGIGNQQLDRRGYVPHKQEPGFQCELTDQEGKLEAPKSSVVKFHKEIEPIEGKLKQIEDQSAEIFEIRNAISTDEELKRTLAEFKDKLEERQQTLKEFEQINAELGRQADKLDGEKSSILIEVGRLDQEAEKYPSRKLADPDFSDVRMRINSFKNAPLELLTGQFKPTHLAPGLVYSGNEDMVACYQCKMTLETWEPNDDPLIEHIRLPVRKHCRRNPPKKRR